MGDEVPWPNPPRDPGPWNGGPPVAPPGNTPLPPLPGSSGTMGGAPTVSNPWTNAAVPPVNIPPDRPAPAAAADPGHRPKADRAPTALRIAAGIVVVAMIAGAAYVLIAGGRQYPEAWDARVKPITDWVEKERDLTYDHPVTVNFLTEEEYSERATEGGDADDRATKDYYADQVAQLRALGFASGEVDLAAANDTLSDSGTLAYYDPEIDEVFVRGTELTPVLRVTLAHELTHVLQDQKFDLTRIDDYDDGRAGVLRALAEGDATKVEEAYVADVLTDEERAAYEEESQAAGDEAGDEIEASVPPIMTTLFSAPYILGPRLIAVLDEQDGWRAIDAAIQDPPSEEGMFDPTTLGTDDIAPIDVPLAAPSGTELIEDGEFGPTALYLMLAARMDPSVALAAVDGWGGDRYVVYREDDAVCVAVAVEGDGADQTNQLADALTLWASMSPEGTAAVKKEGDEVRLRACDPGKDAEAVGDEASSDLLVLPVTRTDVYTQALQAGRTEQQARCYAQGVVEALTFAQISDPEGAYVSSPEGQQALVAIAQDCFG